MAAADAAVCTLGPAPNSAADTGVRGTVSFKQAKGDAAAPVTVNYRISGLAPGPHGFHIHALGDLTQGCMSAGGHFNPAGAPHGGPADAPSARHVGDLGNIVAGADGVAEGTLTDALLALSGAGSIVGRSVIVHADEDDLGKGGFPDSLTTGHAGARLACGVIGLAADATL